MRDRFNNHHWASTNEKNNPFNPDAKREKLQNTTLSSHIWKLKLRKIDFKVSWKIMNQVPAYKKETGNCQLCLEEKTSIMFANKKESLNKRTEIMQKCRHRDKYLLKHF